MTRPPTPTPARPAALVGWPADDLGWGRHQPTRRVAERTGGRDRSPTTRPPGPKPPGRTPGPAATPGTRHSAAATPDPKTPAESSGAGSVGAELVPTEVARSAGGGPGVEVWARVVLHLALASVPLLAIAVHVFVIWTKTAEQILESLQRLLERSIGAGASRGRGEFLGLEPMKETGQSGRSVRGRAGRCRGSRYPAR